MNNEERDQALYKYPNSSVLRNKLNIRDAQTLKQAETDYVQLRMLSDIPTGKFDLPHLQAIHKHLFQDVYEWAGETRQTIINKGQGENKSVFPLNPPIDLAMADVHKRLSQQNYLRGLPADKFAAEAAEYIGDVNRIHPFRDGNGRTQFQYLKQLGQQAGHDIDLTRFERESWIQASIEANRYKCAKMAACIETGIVSQSQAQQQDTKSPAPDGSEKPLHKVDFEKLRKDVEEIKRSRAQDKSITQSDDGIDI